MPCISVVWQTPHYTVLIREEPEDLDIPEEDEEDVENSESFLGKRLADDGEGESSRPTKK